MDTHTQNGLAERFGRLIMEKACAMQLSANLLYKLWRKIVAAATYLYNRSPHASNKWMLPYQAFHSYVFDKKKSQTHKKPLFHHLRAYDCKVYTLIKSKSDPHYSCKQQKLDARAYIRFLVGYESTNIYRIWILHKIKVISVQDVIFDKNKIYDGKPIVRTSDKIRELNKAIEIVEVPPSKEIENIHLEEDINIKSALTVTCQINHKVENLDANNTTAETKHITDKLVEIEEQEWAQNQYPTPDFSIFEAFLANSVSMPVTNCTPIEHQDTISYIANPCKSEKIEPTRLDQLFKQQNQRFYNFTQYRVLTKLQTAFVAGAKVKVHKQNLPQSRSTIESSKVTYLRNVSAKIWKFTCSNINNNSNPGKPSAVLMQKVIKCLDTNGFPSTKPISMVNYRNAKPD